MFSTTLALIDSELRSLKAVAHDFEGSSMNRTVDCCENILDKVFLGLVSL